MGDVADRFRRDRMDGPDPFWINGEGQWNLPRSAYFMAGAGGQHTFIVPSHDLVVVRMGDQRGVIAGTKVAQPVVGGHRGGGGRGSVNTGR
jgi:CubicO group peptidase (beta-lactamase class C family)